MITIQSIKEEDGGNRGENERKDKKMTVITTGSAMEHRSNLQASGNERS